MDFDVYFSEAIEKPIPFHLYGKEYSIAPTLPVGIMLQYQELSRRGIDSEVKDAEVIDMVKLIFGADNVTEWSTRSDFDLNKMLKMLDWAMRKYNIILSPKDEKEEKKTQRGKAKE